MDEKKLKIVLALFPVVIIIIAAIIPLSASGWDFEKAFYGTEPDKIIQSFELTGRDAGGDYFTPKDYGLSDDKTSVILTGVMNNPYSNDITVKTLVYSIIIGGETTDLTLTDSVVIPKSGTGEVVLSAPVSDKQIYAIASGKNPTYGANPLKGFAFDMSGVEVTAGGV